MTHRSFSFSQGKFIYFSIVIYPVTFFKNSFIEIQFTYHIIHPFEVYSSVFFKAYPQGCANITRVLILEHFNLSLEKTQKPRTH